MHIGPQRLHLKTVDCVPFLSSSGAKVMLTQGGGGHGLRKCARGPGNAVARSRDWFVCTQMEVLSMLATPARTGVAHRARRKNLLRPASGVFAEVPVWRVTSQAVSDVEMAMRERPEWRATK